MRACSVYDFSMNGNDKDVLESSACVQRAKVWSQIYLKLFSLHARTQPGAVLRTDNYTQTHTLVRCSYLLGASSRCHPPFCDMSEQEKIYPETSPHKMNSTVHQRSPGANSRNSSNLAHFHWYISFRLFGICLVIWSDFLGDLMSFVETHPSGCATVGL